MNDIQAGELYTHYKGDTYKIITLAKHSETKELLVIYERQTNLVHNGDWKIYARPLSMFLENVTTENYSGPRFIKVV